MPNSTTYAPPARHCSGNRWPTVGPLTTAWDTAGPLALITDHTETNKTRSDTVQSGFRMSG
jgi:hypothetical protein